MGLGRVHLIGRLPLWGYFINVLCAPQSMLGYPRITGVVWLIVLIFLCSQILSCTLFLVLWLCWLFRSSTRMQRQVRVPETLPTEPPRLAALIVAAGAYTGRPASPASLGRSVHQLTE